MTEYHSNLIRRASPDGEESGPNQQTSNKHIVNCTKRTIISSFNARTLGPIGRLEELTESTKSQEIDIVAVQEHRFYHPDDILKYHQVGSYQLVTSSASKNSSNASVGGVGFLLSSKASKNLLDVESISPRIMVLELEGNPKTTVICVYSPHNASPEDEVEDFYTTFRSTVEQVPLYNFLVIAGDLNAQTGLISLSIVKPTAMGKSLKISWMNLISSALTTASWNPKDNCGLLNTLQVSAARSDRLSHFS